jgi:hypothetical protein
VAKPTSEPPAAPEPEPPPTEIPVTEVASTEPTPSAVAPTEPAPAKLPEEPAAPQAEPEKPAAPAAPEPAKVSAAAMAVAETSQRISEAPQRPSAPMSAAPKTKPAAAPARREPYIPPTEIAGKKSKRVKGEDLIVELFEACADMSFHRDSLEGAEFILTLALEKLPSEVGLVSLFDINRREFVVVRQAGGARSIVLSRLPERAGLAQAAMRKRSAIVVASAAKDPRAEDDRFRTLGLELKSLMVAPVEQSGRYLGLIELCNPLDDKPFTEADGNALTYIGEQYAEFVAERGPLLDPDTVIDRHQKR